MITAVDCLLSFTRCSNPTPSLLLLRAQQSKRLMSASQAFAIKSGQSINSVHATQPLHLKMWKMEIRFTFPISSRVVDKAQADHRKMAQGKSGPQ